MNVGLIAKVVVGAATAISVVTFAALKSSEGKATEYMKGKLKDEAAEARDKADVACRVELNQVNSVIHSMKIREDREFANATKKFCRESGHNDKVRALNAEPAKRVAEFKKQIGYENSKNAAKKAFDEACATWDSSNDFYETKKNLENDIATAEKTYASNVALVNASGSSIDDDIARTLKQSAEKTRDDAVKAAKDKLTTLKKSREDAVLEFKKDKDRAINSLDKDVREFEEGCKKEASRELAALNTTLREQEEVIRNDIHAKRSEEEVAALSKVDELRGIVDRANTSEASEVREKLNEMSRIDILGEYLKSKNIGRCDVLVLGALPLIPMAYVCFRYIKYVLDLAKAVA